uniref:CENP-V/GFA domain-containing protein n=1 Tax=Bionectria ochroleuca TaxID=29856 RepID=A0A8H7MXZ9_BIOOC
MDSEFLKMKVSGKDLPWFVDPEKLKHMCGFDPCDSCRPMFGVDMVHWTFVLAQQVEFAENTGKPFPADTLQLKEAISGGTDRDPRLGTLSLYASSPDVQRYFCSRCSASVFYAVDDRPELLDVAAGLLWRRRVRGRRAYLPGSLDLRLAMLEMCRGLERGVCQGGATRCREVEDPERVPQVLEENQCGKAEARVARGFQGSTGIILVCKGIICLWAICSRRHICSFMFIIIVQSSPKLF